MSPGFPSTCSETQSSEILAIQKERDFFSATPPRGQFPFPLHHLQVHNTICDPPSPSASAARLTQCYVDYVEGEDVDGEE